MLFSVEIMTSLLALHRVTRKLDVTSAEPSAALHCCFDQWVCMPIVGNSVKIVIREVV